MIGKIVLAGGVAGVAVAIMAHASEPIFRVAPVVGGVAALVAGGVYGWLTRGGAAATALAGGVSGGGTALAGIALGIALGDLPLATLSGVGGGTLFGAVGASMTRLWVSRSEA